MSEQSGCRQSDAFLLAVLAVLQKGRSESLAGCDIW
jgi:hypothetical protein